MIWKQNELEALWKRVHGSVMPFSVWRLELRSFNHQYIVQTLNVILFVCLQQWQATLVRVIIRSPQEHPKQCDHWSGQVQSGRVGGQSYQTGWSPVGSCSRSLPAPARDEMIWIEIFKCHSLIKVSYVWQERKMIRKQSNMYISKNPLMTTNKFQFIKSNYQRTCDFVSLLSGLEEDPVWRFPNPEANGTGSFINPLFSSVFA